MPKLIITLLLLCITFSLSAKESMLDLSQQAWQPGSILVIDTEWDFFWNQFHTPDFFTEPSNPPITFPVPRAWNSEKGQYPTLPGNGKATYRLKIKVPENVSRFFLYVPDMASAYQLWNHNKLVAYNGKIGASKEEEIPEYGPQTVEVEAKDGLLDLILLTSNFHYMWGGVWYPLQLTDDIGLFDLREKPIIKAVSAATLLLLTCIFSLTMYFSRRKEPILLPFGLLCLVLGFRRLLIDERVLYIFDGLSWETLQTIENLCTYLAFPLFISYFSHRFRNRCSLPAMKLSWGFTLPFCFLAIFTEVALFTNFNVPFQLIVLCSFPYIFITYGKALVNRKKGIWLFGIGLLIFSVTVLNDILAYNYIIHSPNLVHFGVIAFIALQALDLVKGYLKNVTKIEHMTKALKQRNKELVRLDNFKDDFLATTSHELRTPLHGISGLAAHLKDSTTTQLNPTQTHQLELIASTSKRLGSLVNDILDFSGIKHGNLQLHRANINLKTISEQVIKTLEPLTTGRDIKLSSTVSPEATFAYADANRVQQILFNLLGNSVKFTAEGFIQLSVVLSEDKNIVLEVSDSGMGIPPDKQDLLFQPFHRIHAENERPEQAGSGLGLTISKQLVELHGSQLEIESKEGFGTTVKFHLPVGNAQDAINNTALKETEESILVDQLEPTPQALFEGIETADTSKEFNKDSEPTMDSTIVIYIVDDEEVNRELLKAQLQKEGITTKAFTNGFELLEHIDNAGDKLPHLILLDYMMPDITGLEVCQKLRTKYDAFCLPIMMVTARYQVEDISECLSAGANDYLIKPYHKKELMARVYSQLNTRKFWLSDKENKRLKEEIENRERLQTKLAEANERLIGALDISHEPMALINSDVTVLYKNKAFSNLFSGGENSDINLPETTGIAVSDTIECYDQNSHTEHVICLNKELLPENDGEKIAFSLAIHLIDEEEQQNFALIITKKESASVTDPNEILSQLSQELAENRSKFDQIEAALQQVSTLVGKADNEPETKASGQQHGDKRELLVKLLRTSLLLWERYTGKNKVALAEESQCWRVYLDGTTAKTRTLDRYLSIKSLPDKPRWRLAVRTATFVIDHCQLSGEDFNELSGLIDQLSEAFS